MDGEVGEPSSMDGRRNSTSPGEVELNAADAAGEVAAATDAAEDSEAAAGNLTLPARRQRRNLFGQHSSVVALLEPTVFRRALRAASGGWGDLMSRFGKGAEDAAEVTRRPRPPDSPTWPSRLLSHRTHAGAGTCMYRACVARRVVAKYVCDTARQSQRKHGSAAEGTFCPMAPRHDAGHRRLQVPHRRPLHDAGTDE